jgi:hypothetical protein
MTSLLDGLIDSRYIPAVTWLIIGVIAVIVAYAGFRVVRMLTSGTYIAGGRNRRTRLAVLDAAAVDDRRRLVLVRRDDVEHLILIGGPTDVVVEQDIRLGARTPRAQAPEPARTIAPDPDHALDAYDHGDEALQPNPIPSAPPRQVPAAPQRQPSRVAEKPPVQRAPAASRPINVEPAPAPSPPPPSVAPQAPVHQAPVHQAPTHQAPAHQQVATRPVAPMPPRQSLAPVAQQAPAPAPPQQVPTAARQQRTIRPVLPRVTLPAATQPNFQQPVEERREQPVVARVTPHPARAQQATRRAQQHQPQPQAAPAPVENELDDALLQELETSLRYPARERTRAKAADIDEEMNKLLGEMSRDRR